MKLDTNTLLLFGALGVGGFLLYSHMSKGKTGNGLSPSDMAIMQALKDQQASAAANQAAMMRIIQEAKASGDPEKMANPWTHPDTIVKFAQLGVQVAGMFV